jgi:hypothetical protein
MKSFLDEEAFVHADNDVGRHTGGESCKSL